MRRKKYRRPDYPTFASWRDMRYRCLTPTAKAYPKYGGRGITVCDRWKSYANFLADMGERPAGLFLDRIDNNGSYSPENCRWATRLEQQNNLGWNIRLTLNGITDTLTGWASRLLIKRDTIERRFRQGWPVERILAA